MDIMKEILAGRTDNPKATLNHNTQLLDRGKNLFVRENDTRDFVRYVMATKGTKRSKPPPNKFFEQASKNMMSTKDMWKMTPPKHFIGTQLQWICFQKN